MMICKTIRQEYSVSIGTDRYKHDCMWKVKDVGSNKMVNSPMLGWSSMYETMYPEEYVL